MQHSGEAVSFKRLEVEGLRVGAGEAEALAVALDEAIEVDAFAAGSRVKALAVLPALVLFL